MAPGCGCRSGTPRARAAGTPPCASGPCTCRSCPGLLLGSTFIEHPQIDSRAGLDAIGPGDRNLGHRAAGGLDGGTRAGRDPKAPHRDPALDLARAHDPGCLAERGDQPGLLEHGQIDFVGLQALEVSQPDGDHEAPRDRSEATLGKPAMQRHLAALEADLVEAAGTGLLALVAAPRSLAPTAADAAPDPVPG